MIKFLLQELEKSPHPLFSKTELLSRSPKDFENLLKKKIITYFRPQEGEAEQINSPRCQHGCALTIVEGVHGLEGVCFDHPEEDPVTLTPDDLTRYAVSVSGLLEEIRTANGIGGSIQSIEGGYYHFGHKMYGESRVGFVFIRAIGDEALLTLTGLRSLCDDADLLVVVTPISIIDNMLLRKIFSHEKVIQTALIDSLDPTSFELRVDDLTVGTTQREALRIAPLKFQEEHFLEVDALIQEQYQTTAAIKKVANRHGFNVESFKRQFYQRHYPTKRTKI